MMNLQPPNNSTHQLKDLFKAPMDAVVEADMELSEKITKFIINYGFEAPGDGDIKKIHALKMVHFSYTINDKTVEFSIPVLTLIQLPLLRIKTADFDMKVKLFTVNTSKEKEKPSFLKTETKKEGNSATRLKAYLAPETNDSYEKTKANMNVKLSMVDGDMPAGMIQLLGLLSELNKVNKEK